MTFLRKSILGKVFVYFISFATIVSAVVFLFYMEGRETVPFDVFVGGLGTFILFFLLVYIVEIARPLERILVEMKALLAGKKYKKIYTTKIDEIGVLAHFFNEVTTSLEGVSAQIREEKRMMDELEIAAELQRDILPSQNPQVAGLDIIAKTRPAVELGGDSFDFITMGDNTFIYVGDVTGHGVPAAIVMTMVNTLIHTFAEIYDTAYEIIVGVNKQLKSRIKSTMFMTVLMLKWNNVTHKMSYVGAGHEHILIYKAKKGKCEIRQSGGIALGMVPDNSQLVKEIDMPLEKDDVIVLYSDGVTEGRNMTGEMYGLDRFIAAIEKFAPQYSADGIIHHIALDYSKYVGDHIQEDDVTMIVIKYSGKAENGGTSTKWEEKIGPQKAEPEKKKSKAKKAKKAK